MEEIKDDVFEERGLELLSMKKDRRIKTLELRNYSNTDENSQ